MGLVLLFFRGGGDDASAPSAADVKRIPTIPRLATIPTLNRKKKRGR